ncbi:MAG: OadG family protein [Lachnospiraceae bacterium]
MSTAILNTVLGMGTVFLVLIMMMGVIYSFRLIPLIMNKLNPLEEMPVAPVVEVEEPVEEAMDLTLVAIISAAIAAYEGGNNTDGIVIRSIKKSRRRQ